MSLPPPAVLPLLSRWTGERYLGAALTAGVHIFAPKRLGGRRATAAIWCVATSERLWLCAWEERSERLWSVAVGEPDQVQVDANWQRDVLHVGPWMVAIKRGGRKEIQDLIKRWGVLGPSGDPWPLSMEIPGAPGPIASGAAPVPEALGHSVPGVGDERWLAAVETDASWPLTGFGGSVEVPVLVAASDQRAALVALHPDGAPAWLTLLPAGALPTQGRAWELGTQRLTPRGARDLVELVDALMAVGDPADRWALACRQAIIAGSPRRCVQLVAEAWSLRRAEHVWAHLGQVVLAMKQGPLAVATTWRALVDDPALNAVAVADLWTLEAPAVKRVVRANKLPWREVRRLAGAAFDALAEVPSPPDLLPWPPQSADEAWATALVLHGRAAEARSMWARSGSGARAAVADAVLAAAAGADDTAAAWRTAAIAARPVKGPAFRLLAHAAAIDEVPSDRWAWAAWAWEDGRREEARAHWRRALLLAPGGAGATDHALDPWATEALAAVAEDVGLPEVAVAAWRRAIDQRPRAERPRLALAALQAGAAARPLDAAETLVALADAIDGEAIDDPTTPRWQLWLRAAELRMAGGRSDDGRLALRECLAGDFLDVAAWDAVIACDVVPLPPEERAWWAHVRRALAGAAVDDGAPLAGLESLDDATLDALHPGGAGWLANLRRSLDATEAPSYDALTRGLDRLAEAGFDQAVEVLDAECVALELERVPAGHVFRGKGAWGVSAWPSDPPVLLVGAEHLREGPRRLEPNELAFAIAAELVHLRCDHPVLTFDATWLGTSRSVYDSVNGWAGTAETVFDIVTLLPGLDQVKKIQTVVKIAKGVFMTRGAVSKAVSLTDPVSNWLGFGGGAAERGLSREGLSGAALQFRLQAERAALLLSGDLRSAVRTVLKESTTSAELVARADHDGLLALLADPGTSLTGDELVRLTALVEFAATRLPWTSHPPA